MRMVSALALAAALHASVLAATRVRAPIALRDHGLVTVTITAPLEQPRSDEHRADDPHPSAAASLPAGAAPTTRRDPPRRSRTSEPTPSDTPSASIATAAPAPRSESTAIPPAAAAPAPAAAAAGGATDEGSVPSGVATSGLGGGAGGGTRPGSGTSGAAGGGSGGGGGDDDLARRIRSRIVQHRRYPALARRRGIEGTVRLSLAVRPDGSVEVAVVRGADPMLDEAAREAVLAAAPLPVVRERLEIDLEYRLIEP